MSSVVPGQLLLGKYRVERVLGRGGMGLVLSAVHLELDTRVAVKILHADSAQSAEIAGRFLREAQAASKLRSEFVARTTDFGRLESGEPFMVMELLEGEDFEAILARGKLPRTEAVDSVLQASAALAEAHAAGIIHRDIKPSNLFLTTRPDGTPCVKVLDFGISKILEQTQPLTRTGRAFGTPLYMSPEQIRGLKDIDRRTDVWSLGVVLYQMLAGEPPFVGEGYELLARILEAEPAPLATRRPELPTALVEVVHRCLEKDRARRVTGMSELASLLAPFASSEGALAARRATIVGQEHKSAAAPPAGPAIGMSATLLAPEVSSPQGGEPDAAPAATPARRRVGAAVLAAAALALGLLGLGRLSARGDRACDAGDCAPRECTRTTDCPGPAAVCRRADGKCVSLLNDLCTSLASSKKDPKDAYSNDDVVIFGSIGPTAGPNARFGGMLEDGIRLALDDFGKVNGIPAPNGGSNRPLVVVFCNDGPNEDRGSEAAKHLVDDLGVPAIIGHPFSGSAIKIATDVTIPAGVLLFSPTATSMAITSLIDHDLVWRTAPPDSLQARAMVGIYPNVESSVRARYPMIAGGPIKVAVVHAEDVYGAGLADAVQEELAFNGHPATRQAPATLYQRFDYGTSARPDLGVLDRVTAFGPHVIFLLGNAEGVDPILKGIEAGWKAQADLHRPLWLVSDGILIDALWKEVVTTDELRQRLLGTTPGEDLSYAPYASFNTAWISSRYHVAGSPEGLGAADAYDITYMLAYSAVAVGADKLTGANLVKYGLRRMVPGAGVAKVAIGPSKITDTFPALMARTPIDIEGASGHLDFDLPPLSGGEAASNIQLWCLPRGAGAAPAGAARSSGVYYDSSAKKITGALDPGCGISLSGF